MRRVSSWVWAASLVALAGCDDGNNAGSGAGDASTIEGGDHPVAAALRLDEATIGARVGQDGTTVRLLLRRTGTATLRGEALIKLIKIDDGSVAAESTAELTADAIETVLEIPLDFVPPSEQPADLAGYVIDYAVSWPGDGIWGKRSLYAALALTEVQLVGSDRLRTDGVNHLRVLARDPTTGEPRAGLPVRVALVDGEGNEAASFGASTDASGEADVPIDVDEEALGEHEMVVQIDAPEGEQVVRAAVVVERATKVLVTTDKPLYQPGQIIHLRALALRRPSLQPVAEAPLVFEVFDGKDNKVERLTLTTDDFGVAHGKFQLAREVNQGRYRISATLDGVTTEKTVTVERYALPKYDVDVQLDREVYLAGAHLRGTLTARYFFGQPVQGGRVRLVASTFDAGESVFAEQQGATNEDGVYAFELDLPQYVVGLPLEQGGGLVQLAFEVTDAAGQSRQVAKTLRIAPAALEVFVVPESGAVVPGVANRFLVRTLDAEGQPVAANHVMTLEGNALAAFDTDADGLGHVEAVVVGPTVVADVVSTDGEGNEVTNHFEWVAGQTTGAVLLRTERALYRVGDTLRAEVFVAGARDRVYFDAIVAGQTVLTRTLEPDASGHAVVDLDLSGDFAGAVRLDAYTLALGSSLRRDTAFVYVNAADDLHIAVSTDREVYAPGDEAQVTFTVTDGEGLARAAAIGLQIVDEAVFSLLEFRPGLERTYFRLEGELAAPRYQIGVPGLATLAGDPGAPDDPVAQDEARLLFAASGDVAGPAIAVNTHQAAQGRVLQVVTPAIQGIVDEVAAALQADLGVGFADEAAVRMRLATERRYDPWGQLIDITVENNQARFHSAGPDERADTADDVTIVRNTYCDLLGQCPQAGGDFDADGEFAGGGPANEPGAAPPADRDDEGGGGNAAPRVRRDFPETLLVQPALITDGDGVATLTVPLADSITTWRLSALANARAGLLGSTDAGIRVFQDFFVDVAFPATLTRGDVFTVPIALYNYLDRPQTVRVEVMDADWLTILGDAEQVVQLAPGEVAGIELPVQVDRVGVHPLTVFAYGEALQDAVERTVEVVPDGREVRNSWSGRLTEPVRREVTLPAEAIEGSGKLLVKLYPGLFSAVIEGLDGILRMPSGCFEQTSSTTWPNVLVTRYLHETNTQTPEIEATANGYVNTGYQRLLTFEVNGGGFEWFGNDPAHTVLTAYGLLEFVDMAQVRTVDEAMIARTRAWLLGQQQADGHWEVNGRGLDETGNLSDPVTVTAYVAFALAAAGETGAPMDHARTWLQGHLDGMGTYTLALTANFLVALDPGAQLTGQVLDTLASAVDASLGDHWQTDEQTTTYGQGEPAYIETTALAAHALLKAGSHGDTSSAALTWLVGKKDSYGTWGSTAGTVWTIKCLLEALAGGRDEAANATIRVLLDGVERATFQVLPDNSDVLRQADLSEWLAPGEPQLVEIEIEGQGSLQYGIVQAFHVPFDGPAPGEGPLHIDVTYDRTTLSVDDTVTVSVDVRNDSLEFADMVMVDLGIAPGFSVQTADLDALIEQGVFRKYDLTERQLLLYFQVITPENPVHFEYRIVARNPIRAQAPASRVYSYYNPDVGAEGEPIDIEVE